MSKYNDIFNEVITLFAVDYTKEPIELVWISAKDMGDYYRLSDAIKAFNYLTHLPKSGYQLHPPIYFNENPEQALLDYIETQTKLIRTYYNLIEDGGKKIRKAYSILRKYKKINIMNKEKIYMVSWIYSDDFETIAVFDDEELAQTWLREYELEYGNQGKDLGIVVLPFHVDITKE